MEDCVKECDWNDRNGPQSDYLQAFLDDTWGEITIGAS